MVIPIYVSDNYTILGKIEFEADATELRFTVPIEGTNPAQIEILPKENKAVVSQKRDISDNLWEFLKIGNRDIPPALRTEFSAITSDTSFAIKRVLSLIKYSLGYTKLDERLVSHNSVYWSTDNIDWKPLPILMEVSVDWDNIYPLNKDSAKSIQHCLDCGFEPFMALRHLHKAKIEIIPRYKWLDATIAAELAIKEFFIRLKPEIATLLFEVPSPPLDKLYGSVLESFGFQKSPKLKEIIEGIKIRNKLIHRPEEIKIDSNKANKYIRDIKTAIYHLVLLLHPNDPYIKFLYAQDE